MSIRDDHFSLFGLPVRFAIDEQALDSAYKRVQQQVHPDRFAAATAAERRVAMQWAARANEALQTLRSPLRRATYLCELHGASIDAESNTAMSSGFLTRQMTWREELDDVRTDVTGRGFEELEAEVRAAEDEMRRNVADAIDVKGDFATAAALVRQWMFIDKFRAEVRAAAHATDVGAG